MDVCAASIDLEGVVNGCFEDRAPGYRECQIKCLQDMKALTAICEKLNLKIRKPSPEELLKDPKPLRPDEYEVEEILDHGQYKCQDWYFVKWKGWESEFNTWEPYRHLTGCRELVKEFHEKRRMKMANLGVKRKWSTANETKKVKLERAYKFVLEICKAMEPDLATLLRLKGMSVKEYEDSGRTIKKLKQELKEMFSSSFLNGSKAKLKKLESCLNPDLMDFAEKRKVVLKQLKAWEDEINALPDEKIPILVENNVDLEGPPANFTYITDYKAGEDISLPDDPLVGCECENCYENQKNCCAMQCGGSFAYSKFGYLKVGKGTPIYECNKRCKCGPDCLNRVVQKGRQVKLSIFRTCDGRGWGVRTLEKIKKGTFVMEYVGEIITNEEAERRGKIYDAEGRTYLFDLDYNDGDCPFTVDAAFYGNVAHFMNHSCDPNLLVYAVWINNLDPRLPRIAFFAHREIRKGEELTFDYLMTGSPGSAVVSPSKGVDMSQSSPVTTQRVSTPRSSSNMTSPEKSDNRLPTKSPNKVLFPEIPSKEVPSTILEENSAATLESVDSTVLPDPENIDPDPDPEPNPFSYLFQRDVFEELLNKLQSPEVHSEADSSKVTADLSLPQSDEISSSHPPDDDITKSVDTTHDLESLEELAPNNISPAIVTSTTPTNGGQQDVDVTSNKEDTLASFVQKSKTGSTILTNSPLSFHSLSKVSPGSQITRKRIKCKCGANVCRGYLF